MAIKPELLQVDTTAADSDIIMKTDTTAVTKVISAANFFSWLWGKIKGSTKSALDTSDPTAPVNTTAVNGALTNLSKLKIIDISNANNCIPSELNKIEYYSLSYPNTNCPTENNDNWYLESVIQDRSMHGYSTLYYQKIVSFSNGKTYVRTSADGNTWSNWQEYALNKTKTITVEIDNNGNASIPDCNISNAIIHCVYGGNYVLTPFTWNDNWVLSVRTAGGLTPSAGTQFSITIIYSGSLT